VERAIHLISECYGWTDREILSIPYVRFLQISDQVQESQNEKWRQLSHLGWQIKAAIFSVIQSGQAPESFNDYFNSFFCTGSEDENITDSKTAAENSIKKANEILLKFSGGGEKDGTI
jgi:hypothetical protein